jgi:hypothetical protein
MGIFDIIFNIVEWICIKIGIFYEWKDKINQKQKSKKLHDKLHKYDGAKFSRVENVREMRRIMKEQKKEK